MMADFSDLVEVTPGCVTLADGAKLYYELRSPKSSTVPKRDHEKMIMMMGAWATLKHFEEMANVFVAHFSRSKTPLQIITYDHRGIGKSGPATPVRQTSQMLAEDALSLINQVWGETGHVHLFGASLGGMIAQELAIPLIQSKRLRSLYLAITMRGYYIRATLPTWLLTALMPFAIQKDREQMLRQVVKISFKPEHAEEHGERFVKMWLSDYDGWFSFSDHEACASQISAVLTHYLPSEKVHIIRDAGVPITVQIAARDKIIPPNKQRELAKLLNANATIIDQGHVTAGEHATRELNGSVICHIENAAFNQTSNAAKLIN